MTSAEGRERYRRAWRGRAWSRAHARGGFLTCRLEGGLRMRVNSLDLAVSRRVYFEGTFEPDELAFIRREVRPGMIAVDVGANIGVHTLVLSQCVGDKGRVYAFEPSNAYQTLEHNIRLNGFQKRVRLNSSALGERVGALRLVRCAPGKEAFTSRGQPVRADFATGETFEVPMTSLDEYAEHNGISRIDFLKLDAEGSEPAVVRGAHELLTERRIRCLMLEVNETCLLNCGSSPEKLIATLASYGLRLQLLGKGGVMSPCPASPEGDWTTVVAMAH